MRILIATDAFPPICGGSGWSTYELARGLRQRGHLLVIVQPRVGAASSPLEYDGFQPIEFRAWAPAVPFVRNYFKNERLYDRLAPFLVELIRTHAIELVHAQHLLTAPPSVAAARQAGVPVVCTVRDYWPVCYWSNLLYDRVGETLCPACSAGMMTRCVRPHAGALWPAALPFIPYMRSNLERKRNGLAGADAVVAVGSTLARDLKARAPELRDTRVEIIPNPVDLEALDAVAARSRRPLDGPYAVYVGKLEPNKGAGKLLPAAERGRLHWPLVVVGDGSERTAMEAAARRAGREVQFTGWLQRDEVLAWLRHASMMIFPSAGPESLSRVLLEASALGVPIAAMDTGGTKDIIVDEGSGLLSANADELGDDIARLQADEPLRRRLGHSARLRVEQCFASGVVIDRIERLYRELEGRHRH
jgi:glycosyltransferase involved in cell wall biosynthesis